MSRHVVCRVAELPPGSMRIVRLSRFQEVGVFNLGGRFYALKNTCPHQGAPLCRGPITGTTVSAPGAAGPPQLAWVREGEIVRCPWHRWEFEIATGRTVFPSRMRVKTFPVHVEPGAVPEDGDVVVIEA